MTPPPGGQRVELRELAAEEKAAIKAVIMECLEGHLVTTGNSETLRLRSGLQSLEWKNYKD